MPIIMCENVNKIIIILPNGMNDVYAHAHRQPHTCTVEYMYVYDCMCVCVPVIKFLL